MIIDDLSTIKMYKSHGWAELKEKDKDVRPVAVEETLTKKELQTKLDGLSIQYKPNESKAALIKKLKEAGPANDFNDGLLKG